MPTEVVHTKNGCDIFIGRPSKWGNPFIIGRDGTREEVIRKYEEWIVHQPELLAALIEVKDKKLGCFCKPADCHGDVLAFLADLLA
jgi:hypothetical protein